MGERIVPFLILKSILVQVLILTIFFRKVQFRCIPYLTYGTSKSLDHEIHLKEAVKKYLEKICLIIHSRNIWHFYQNIKSQIITAESSETNAKYQSFIFTMILPMKYLSKICLYFPKGVYINLTVHFFYIYFIFSNKLFLNIERGSKLYLWYNVAHKPPYYNVLNSILQLFCVSPFKNMWETKIRKKIKLYLKNGS